MSTPVPRANVAVMGLLRTLAWLAAFACCTFLFVVLFEHGCPDVETFAAGARQELRALVNFFRERLGAS
ncbi:hypothetical protein BH23VER1_BH23VER1_19490 [soil metagenome]